MTKTVYWRVKEQKAGSLVIEFWTKDDRKDLCTEDFVIFDNDRLRFRVESKLKLRGEYELQQLGRKI